MTDGPLDGADGPVGIEIKIDGTQIDDDVVVQSVVVNLDLNRIPQALVVIQSGGAEIEDFGELDSDSFKIGAEIEIGAFYGSGDVQTLFKGIVASMRLRLDARQGQSLELMCRDKAMQLTNTLSTAQYLAKKDSDVMTAVISDAGLSADVAATTEEYDQLRVATSDWEFLRLLADRNGMVIGIDDGTVTVKAPDLSASPPLMVTLGADMLSYDVQIDAQRAIAKATYVAWNSATGDVESGEHSTVTDPTLGNVSGSDITGVFNDREITEFIGPERPQAQLTELAKARLLRAGLAAVHGTCTYPGSNKAAPGDMLEISGASERFSGKGYVAGVRHEVRNGAWTTTARLGLPLGWVADGLGMGAAMVGGRATTPAPGLHIGTVEKLSEDPDSKQRIQVKLPVLSGAEDVLVWARYATPYAGNEMGVQFLPEIGDEVVVGFGADDPDAPFILGSLHAPESPRPTEATEDNFIKQIVTREALKVTFDDEKKVITFETPGGHSVTLDDDQTLIKLEDSSGNTITMSEDGITIDTPKDLTLSAGGNVDITAAQDATVKGTNVTCEGDMGFTGKGGSDAELNGGAQAIVKGSMVMIN